MNVPIEFAKSWYKFTKDMKTYMEHALAPTLTEGQLNVLEYVMNAEMSVKPSDLIDHLATTPAAITTLLDRMEKNELIRRVRDEKDRRIVWIQLTGKGKREGERGQEIRRQYLESALGKISSHNQQLLVYLLGKVSNL